MASPILVGIAPNERNPVAIIRPAVIIPLASLGIKARAFPMAVGGDFEARTECVGRDTVSYRNK